MKDPTTKLLHNMTGFEVAGLTIAVFNLVVKAVETFGPAFKTFASPRTEWEKLWWDLREQSLAYDQTLGILLEPVVTEAELKDMLDNPLQSELWKSRLVHDRLRAKYSNAYIVIMKNITQTAEDLKKVAKFLGRDLTNIDLNKRVSCAPTLLNQSSTHAFQPRCVPTAIG